MVYYQSTPLITKTEQTSQEQFCTPLPTVQQQHTASTISQQQLQQLPHQQQQQQQLKIQLTTSHGYNGATVMPQLQQQLQQQHHQQFPSTTTTSISNNQIAGNAATQHLLNIKKEYLPDNHSVYTTTVASIAATVPIISKGTSANTTTTTTVAVRKNAGTKPQFKCEQCGMTFGSKSAHTSHTKSHAKNGEQAKTAMTTGAAVGSAIEVNEAGVPIGIPKTPLLKPNPNGTPGSDPYQCNVCQKTFAVPARLIRHYRTHTGERPFECEFCHKLFSVKENLQVHRRIHTKERPYKCDVCGRAFEHSGKLHRHMRIHTGERPHKCSVCEKTFIQSGQLVIHMRTHTGEKPYKCPVEGCGKGFTCSKQLKVHSRTHTGEKPYHCDICFRDFGYNHVLKLHRVQHYGSKCYKCTICDETFKSKKEMEAHIKGHANEIPDDEEGASSSNGAAGQSNSSASPSVSGSGSASISSGGTNSAPASPESPVASVTITKVRKPRQERKRVAANTPSVSLIQSSPSPDGSPNLTLSPNNSMASATRYSNVSPTPSMSSPALSIKLETDFVSADSGNASNGSHMSQTTHAVAGNGTSMLHRIDDLPTDLSMQQHNQTLAPLQPPKYFVQQCQQLPKATPVYYGSPPQQQQQPQQTAYTYLQPQNMESAPPTINPALLEAASIAQQEDVTQAALQIMELRRSQQQNQQQTRRYQSIYNPIPTQTEVSSAHRDFTHYNDDTNEANELIEHYKRGDLARHGLHRGYAPVPKFETSLLNNEIVRQVEAAIAPLRSSTDSPDRSSSPESDSMMMADRDVMTLPLRKRKLYMNEGPSHNDAIAAKNGSNGTAKGDEPAAKGLRMSSVIQFAKAS